MFNFFDLNIIHTFLSRFNAKKILLIGLSNKTILNKLILYCMDTNCTLYIIDEINAKNLIKKNKSLSNKFLKDNIKHLKGQSLKILPNLKNFDAVFIDGDPNWYTVFNELTLIKKNNLKFPLVFVCNNKYPHKRRDSYINPNNIPDEYKHDCCNELPITYEENNEIKHAMINDGFCHAIYKETPKNGVLTAIEDFLNENKSLNMIEINFLEGINFIYNNSSITKNKINNILNKETKIKYSDTEVSDKITENHFLLNHISKMETDENNINDLKLKIQENDEEIKNYKEKIETQNNEINTIKTELKSEKEKTINQNKQHQKDSLKIKKELREIENRINNLKHETTSQLSKIEQSEYCIACFKEEISNNKLEMKYLKKNSLTKKILNPFSYLYLLFKSNVKDIPINFKLYKALKNSSCFDIGFYLNNNKDLIGSKWCKYFSLELHYICNGFDENRLFNKKYFNRQSKKELLNYILTCNK